MTIFNSIFIKFEEFFRSMDTKVWGAVISLLLFSALVLFWMSIRKSRKKATLISNAFLFYLAILVLVFALILTITATGFK